MSKKPTTADEIVADPRQGLEQLAAEADKPNVSPGTRNRLRAELSKVVEELGRLLMVLDPIRQPTSVFDPGNPKVVGRFIALALVAQPLHPLAEIGRFYGAGVYAIYYRGAFPFYEKLSRSETPIYVGQASPAINNARTPVEQGDKLCRRLDEHRKNIGKATGTLDIGDFAFRSLVVQSGWETAAEDYLIHLFRPIWNNETRILYGLGKHGDDPKVRSNKRSPWDTLHPGRLWAAGSNLSDSKTTERILEQLDAHFATYPVFSDLNSVLVGFIEELRQI